MTVPAPSLPEAAEPTQPGTRSWAGLWPGTVVDADDPLKQGRVRVRADQVYGLRGSSPELIITDDELPWAIPCFDVTGNGGDGVFHVPPVGAGVWLAFWGGDPEEPIWMGGYPGDRNIPGRVSSAYGPPGSGAQTRYIRTPGGQVMEMRWKGGEEEILLQAPLAPPTPSSPEPQLGAAVKITHSSGQRRIELTTTLGQVIRIQDLPTPQVDIVSSGPLNVTSAGLNYTGVGPTPAVLSAPLSPLTMTFLAAVLTAATTMFLTATGAMTLTAAVVTIVSAGAVNVGIAGTYRRLLDERFATLYDGHIHPDPVSGNTGPPTTLATPSIASYATTNLRGN